MIENEEKNSPKRIQVWLPSEFVAEVRKFGAEETVRFGGKREPKLPELLQKAWAVFRGRPLPPAEPEDETVKQLKEILSRDPEDLGQQARHYVRTIHDLWRLRGG